jgi:DNA-binding transcriptional ArsR family regulator
MTRINAARRNRALRKIRASRHLPPEIKLTVETILDLLSSKSDYCLAWPSAANLAQRTGKSRRTILWHLKAIKQLGIFQVHQFTPDEAKAYALNRYGLVIRLEQCRHQAPNLFEVNPEHLLWDESRTIPSEVEREWKHIVERINATRNAKTTSRLSCDWARWPKVDLTLPGTRLNGNTRNVPSRDTIR